MHSVATTGNRIVSGSIDKTVLPVLMGMRLLLVTRTRSLLSILYIVQTDTYHGKLIEIERRNSNLRIFFLFFISDHEGRLHIR